MRGERTKCVAYNTHFAYVNGLTRACYECHITSMSRDGYRWADTAAAKMLLLGLERARDKRGLSVRQLAKSLDYKQAVVLSHMATGRAPIPLDRAEQIASVLDIDPSKFLRAVLDQRHPEVRWGLITAAAGATASDNLAAQLEIILNAPLSDLNSEQRHMMREIAAERSPARRWLSVHELPLIEAIRSAREADRDRELSDEEIEAILASLDGDYSR